MTRLRFNKPKISVYVSPGFVSRLSQLQFRGKKSRAQIKRPPPHLKQTLILIKYAICVDIQSLQVSRENVRYIFENDISQSC